MLIYYVQYARRAGAIKYFGPELKPTLSVGPSTAVYEVWSHMILAAELRARTGPIEAIGAVTYVHEHFLSSHLRPSRH